MSGDWSETFSELVKLYFDEVIKPILPNASPATSGAMSSPDIMPEVFDLRISTSEMFHDSVYSVDRNCDYIHFTKLPAIERILREKVILASSVSQFLDKDEVQYGFQKMSSVSPQKIERVKGSTYAISLVEESEETRTDSYMWDVYGDLGKGGYLRFEVPMVRYPFAFGKVLYGKTHLEYLSQLESRTLAFQREYNLSANEIEIVLLHLASCHKALRYKNEKEVRLIYSKDYELFSKKPMLAERDFIGSDGTLRKSLEIPVRILTMGEAYMEAPRMELLLKEVVLGYGISDSEVYNILSLILRILPANPQLKIFRLNKELEFVKQYP